MCCIRFPFDFYVFVCYRWKGENVATSEVADILTMAHCILEANVYGVKVEGRNTDVRNGPKPHCTDFTVRLRTMNAKTAFCAF